MLISLNNLAKNYGGVQALTGVSFGIQAGEVHALCGENGAGKSTLIKCLVGVVAPSQGEILVDGKALPPGDIRAAEDAGIAVVHQESTSFPDLDAVDNLFVGREMRKDIFLDRVGMEQRTREVLQRLGQELDIRAPVGSFTVAQRQMVEMARALLRDCRLLILDEPTASLSARETETLLALVKKLRSEGVAVLYVSHRLEEIFELADRTTVLRDGGFVATTPTAALDEAALVAQMVGREVEALSRHHLHEGRTETCRLEVRGLRRTGAFADIDFTVHAGEIVGLAGLVGAGRSEVVNAIFGIDTPDAGEILLDGTPLPSGNIAAALAAGIGLVPEDRQHQGLVLPMTVGENMSLAILQQFVKNGLIDRSAERGRVQELMKELTVKAASPEVPVETLSGGNQQKVVLGKWLANRPKLLMLDEPTRGVDVGAKAEIHRLIRELTSKGMATLVVSSDLPEILALCDRILVMCEGRLAGQLDGATATQADVLRLALPGRGSEESA